MELNLFLLEVIFIIILAISDSRGSSKDTDKLKGDNKKLAEQIELLKEQVTFLIEDNIHLKRQVNSLESKYVPLLKATQNISKSLIIVRLDLFVLLDNYNYDLDQLYLAVQLTW